MGCSVNADEADRSYQTLSPFYGATYFVFDEGGHIVYVSEGELRLQAEPGMNKRWVASVAIGIVSAMARLPGGSVIFLDENGDLVKVTKEGAVALVGSAFATPAHSVVDRDGKVFISQGSRGTIVCVDPETGETSTVASELAMPTGVAFSPDYARLYWASGTTGLVSMLSRRTDGSWSPSEEFGRLPDAPGEWRLSVCAGREAGDACDEYQHGYTCQEGDGGLACSPRSECADETLGTPCTSVDGFSGTCQSIDGTKQCAPVNPCEGQVAKSPCTDGVAEAGVCTVEPMRDVPYCGMKGPCDDKALGDDCRISGVTWEPLHCQLGSTGGLACLVSEPCEGRAEGDYCVTSTYGGICRKTGDLLRCEVVACDTDEAPCVTRDGRAGTCRVGVDMSYCSPPRPCADLAVGDDCLEDGASGVCTVDSEGTTYCAIPQPCDGLAQGERCDPDSDPATTEVGLCYENSLRYAGSLACYPVGSCYDKERGTACTVADSFLAGGCSDEGDPLGVLSCTVCGDKLEEDRCQDPQSLLDGVCVASDSGDRMTCVVGDPCPYSATGSPCRVGDGFGTCQISEGTTSVCRLNGELGTLLVDVEGSVYVTELSTGTVYRISPDGQTVVPWVTVPSTSLSAGSFGSGVGQWDPNALYYSTKTGDTLYGVCVGVPGNSVSNGVDSGNPDGSGGADSAPDNTGGVEENTGTPTTREQRCSGLVQKALATERVGDIAPAEDIAFDGQGYLYWNRGSEILRTKADGETDVFVTGLSFSAGMRFTQNGDLYVANNSELTLERIAPDGTRETVMTGVNLNGIEVDSKGRVYATNLTGTEVFRYEPTTKKSDVLVSVVSQPNGLTLSPDFGTLYLDSWDGSPTRTVFRIPLDEDDAPLRPERWANIVGTGYHDGMAVDECGFVYVANSGGAGQVIRINPKNPFDRVVVVERPLEVLHNFAWGRGPGWLEESLYVVSVQSGLFRADLGVRGKSDE